MNFTILKEDEYSAFLNNHPLKTFVQTVEMAKARKKSGWDYHIVGVKENDNILCATMLFSYKGKLSKKFFSAPRGFLIDFNNKELLTFFTNELKKYIKDKNGYVLNIEPKILYKERDIDGNIIEDGFDNTNIYNNLTELGYKHNGFYLDLDLTKQVRWAFVLDIENKTEEIILKEMRSNTRKKINSFEKYGITTRLLEYEELHLIRDIINSSGERKDFSSRPLEYFQNMYKAFEKTKDILYLVAEMNFDVCINNLNDELEELNKRLSNPTKKTNVSDINNTINALTKKIEVAEKLKEEKGNKVVISGGMFSVYGDEVVYIYGGSYSEYMDFNGQYAVQWAMIKYGLEHHYKTYDFYGISGIFKKEDKRYGVYLFKRGFNGKVIEYIGDFDLVISKPIYLLHKIINKIKNRS